MNKLIVATAISLATACGSAAAQTLFFDDFNNETPGLNRTPSGWTVSNGSVDIIGSGPNGTLFDGRPGNGYYIDLDGSTNNGGRLSTRLSFAAATTYELSFDLSGSGGVENSMTYGIDFDSPLATDEWREVTLSGGQFIRFSLLFSSPVATGGSVVFDQHGGDNIGLLLDDVRVAVIPEPHAWGLLLAGLGLLGFAARQIEVSARIRVSTN